MAMQDDSPVRARLMMAAVGAALLVMFSLGWWLGARSDDDSATGVTTTISQVAGGDADTDGDGVLDVEAPTTTDQDDAPEVSTTAGLGSTTSKSVVTTTPGTTTSPASGPTCETAEQIAHDFHSNWGSGDLEGAGACARAEVRTEILALGSGVGSSFAGCGPGGGSGETSCTFKTDTDTVQITMYFSEAGELLIQDLYSGSEG